MRCETVQEWLGAWEDGEVGSWRRGQIARHVRFCPQCRAEADAVAGLTATLKHADPITFRQLSPLPAPRVYRFGTLRYGMVATLVLLLALTGFYMHHQQAGVERSAARPAVAVRPGGEVLIAKKVMPAKATSPARAVQRKVVIARVIKQTDEAKKAVAFRRRSVRRLERIGRPVLLAHNQLRRPRAVAPPAAPQEIIEISVKIADPQQVARDYRNDIAQAERIAANQQEVIYVVATPEVLDAAENAAPKTTTDAKHAEELP